MLLKDVIRELDYTGFAMDLENSAVVPESLNMVRKFKERKLIPVGKAVYSSGVSLNTAEYLLRSSPFLNFRIERTINEIIFKPMRVLSPIGSAVNLYVRMGNLGSGDSFILMVQELV